jgi:hypothetical protein
MPAAADDEVWYRALMLKKIALVLAGLLLLFVLVVARQPAAFRIERSTQIKAPPAVVYGLVDDFHAWQAWSPWAKLDPDMKTTYSGAARGEGAEYSWAGNGKVGSGRMQIVRAQEPSEVEVQLRFTAPMTATNMADFKFTPEAGGTQVSWAMTGQNGFMGKAFALVMNMDKLVGSDFEKGLAALKQQAEAKAQQ